MKKFFIFVLFICLTAGLAGCTREEEKLPEPVYTVHDLFPRAFNTMMVYEGKTVETRRDADGNPFNREIQMDLVYFKDYVHEHRSQTRILSWINENLSIIAEIYHLEDGKLSMVRGHSSFFEHTDMTGSPDPERDFDIIILLEPLVVGQEWVRIDWGPSKETAKIVSVDTEVTTPFGTFTALVVELYDNLNSTMKREYYAPGIGLVKIENESATVHQFYHLVDIIESEIYENMEIFLGWEWDFEVDEFGNEFHFPVAIFDFMPVSFGTNADLTAIYTEAFKTYMYEAFGHVINPAVAINSIRHDRWEAILHLDMTAAFVDEMTGMGEDERLFLQLFVDTMGYHYNAMGVSLTIDGGAYVSERYTINAAAGDFIVLTLYQGHDSWEE